jgi:hypothetical protein
LSVGPAGLLLLAWRRLAARPGDELLKEKNLAAVLEEFGYAPNDEVVSDLADDLRQLAAGAGTVGMLTGALTAAERCGFARAFGCWLADALLAQRLGWAHAVPLLGAEAALGTSARSRRSALASVATSIETDPEGAKSLLAAQARAALRAIDLFTELERRAERLLGVAPKLRAKAADRVVERLLSDDAIVASEKIAGMSDRGLRRLLDRLQKLGAAQVTDQVARNLLAKERRQLGVGDRLEVADAHQHQNLRLRKVGRLPTSTYSSADGVCIGRPGQMFPAASDRNQIVGSAAQFLADVVDKQIDAAGFADDPHQRLARDRFAGGKDRRLDAMHPFAPARIRRQVIQLPVKQLVS